MQQHDPSAVRRPLRVAAVILAAGRSSRMGCQKALLDLRGESAFRRIRQRFHDAGIRDHHAVLSPAIAEPLRRAGDLADLAVVINAAPDAGLAGSLRLALPALSDALDAFLICPVDVPLFEADHVRALCDGFAAAAPPIAIVAPTDGTRRGHPVLFARRLVPEFLALTADEPPHRVIRRDPERVLHVRIDHPGPFCDLDTPDDYARALSQLGG